MSVRGCNVFGSGLMESSACWQVILAVRCEGKALHFVWWWIALMVSAFGCVSVKEKVSYYKFLDAGERCVSPIKRFRACTV